MSESRSSIRLRAATAGDRELLYSIYASTREEELSLLPWNREQKDAFLRSQFQAQDTDYHARFRDAAFDVVEDDGVPIGRFYVSRSNDELRLLDVALLPPHRARGIGTHLVRALVDEAVTRAVPLRLHVLCQNPARRLYERLGFHPVGEAGVYQQMEFLP
jgi:ribosomal protein S18 acetylase RimI-like enzyme